MKYLLAVTAPIFMFYYSQGQGYILNVGAGYSFSSYFDTYHDTANYYSASIQPSMKYCLDVGYKIDKKFSVNLSLQYQNTTLQSGIRYNSRAVSPDLKTDLLWVQAGGTSHFPGKHLEVFFGTYLGMGLYRFRDLSSGALQSPIRFAGSMRGGIGYFMTKKVGINCRADALFSTDPLTEKFASAGADGNGYNGFFQFSVAGIVTILLF